MAEARRYEELLILQSAGVIKDLEHHPMFKLEVNGVHIGRYTADARYTDVETGKRIVEEVKGWQSRDYPLRKKLFIALFGKEYEHRERDA